MLAVDCQPVSQVTAAVHGTATAVVNLRTPPGVDAVEAQRLLIEHLRRHTPFGAHVEIRPVSLGQPFRARTDGPAYAAMGRAMASAFGREMTTTGQGGSIPLATALAELLPDAEILLLGVEEPRLSHPRPERERAPRRAPPDGGALALFLADLGGLLEGD